MKKIKKIKICPLCREKKFKVLAVLDKEQVERCKNCGLVFLNPQIINKKGDEYEPLNLDLLFNYLSLIRKKQYKKDLFQLKHFIKKGQLLDVGCSQGWFLKEASKAGFKTIGIEPSKKVIKWAQKNNPKVKIIPGELNKKQFKKTSFDVVTAWSVLEHTIDPKEMLRIISYYLKPGGILALRIPNFESLAPKLIFFTNKLKIPLAKKALRDLYQCLFVYKHFFHFSPSTIKEMLNQTGFKILYEMFENSLNPQLLSKRAAVSRTTDFHWANNKLMFLIIKFVYKTAQVINKQDEMVVIAKKTN